MRNIYTLISCFLVLATASAQEISLTQRASLEQVYRDSYESEVLLPFNDLNMEFGYALYKTEITIEEQGAELELENVRDYAAVFVDNKLVGTLTDNRKKLILDIAPGKYTLELYAENIGRITYGPEILDNSKGLFGSITLDGQEIESWVITPLNIKGSSPNNLEFNATESDRKPSFFKGTFNLDNPTDTYLDISGWGMGEVWINGKYMGSFWEEEKQQSIQVAKEKLKKGENQVIIFELKNSGMRTMRLVCEPVFK